MIDPGRGVHVGSTLGDLLGGPEAIEAQAALDSKVEVAVISCVAEHAGRHDVVEFVTIGMALRKQVIPRERKPVREGFGPIKSTIATAEAIASVDGERLASERINEPYHLDFSLLSRPMFHLSITWLAQ